MGLPRAFHGKAPGVGASPPSAPQAFVFARTAPPDEQQPARLRAAPIRRVPSALDTLVLRGGSSPPTQPRTGPLGFGLVQSGHLEGACPDRGDHVSEKDFALKLTAAERAFLEEHCSYLGLTIREREVLYTICSGGTNEGMADRLCIALPTLRTHLMRLNQKLGTTDKVDVIRFVACRLLEGYRSGRIAPDHKEPGQSRPGNHRGERGSASD